MSDKKEGITIVSDTGSSSLNILAALAAARGNPGPERKIVPIKAKPNIEGECGKAWLVNLEAMRKKMGIGKERDATLAHWVVEAPWAHPIWSHYSIVLIHLRPLPKNDAPLKMYLAGATHELWLFACDPDKDLTKLIKGNGIDGMWLSPKNFGSQMIYRSDEEALAKIEEAVKEIVVSGTLSPDTDFQSLWVQRFGNVMVKEDFR